MPGLIPVGAYLLCQKITISVINGTRIQGLEYKVCLSAQAFAGLIKQRMIFAPVPVCACKVCHI